MKRQNIALNNPERFNELHTIPREKLLAAVEKATSRLEKMSEKHGVDFPGCWAINSQYDYAHNRNWVGGMYTGCYWLAFQLTGKRTFRTKAQALTATFRERLDKRIGVDDHDVGFAFSPSCVAEYRLDGVRDSMKTALDAAEYFYKTSYSKEGKFIIRSWKSWDSGS
jgi:unsaturated chondroitin disaccharide hydrolase